MLRNVYNWCLRSADTPYASWALSAVSFAESSFFPIPPDTMLVPMALARPDKAYHYAAVCTVASVIGGILGYAIGAYLYDSVGLWLISLYGYGHTDADALKQAEKEMRCPPQEEKEAA